MSSLHSSAKGPAGASCQDDVVIAVMGCTGTGKSSFIKLLTGDDAIEVGHKLRSQTSDVKVSFFQDAGTGRRITLVDTPGFDDSRSEFTDTEVLRKISEYLVNEYKGSRKLTGIIYLTRISDPRFGGQSSRNLRMFQSLCGSDSFKNVVVVTTFWECVSESEGAEREAELKGSFFSKFVAGGAMFMRHNRTMESALQVLAYVTSLAPHQVQIQQEIVSEKKTLEETEVGTIRKGELVQFIEVHQAEVVKLTGELDALKQVKALTRLVLALEQERQKALLAKLKAETERLELEKGLEEEKKVRRELETNLGKRVDELQRRLAEEVDARRREQEAREADEARRQKDARRARQYRRNQGSKRTEGAFRRERARQAGEARRREEAKLAEATGRGQPGLAEEASDAEEDEEDPRREQDNMASLGSSAKGLQGASSTDDIVIAVMGCTGTGKSSFIRLLTGDQTVEVGHKLSSQTSDVRVSSFQDPATARRVTVVDTPGFDDSRTQFTDTEVLKKISEFLVNEYKGNRKLNGIIYLTRISDPRFGGQSTRNLNMFKSLCGSETFKNVVVLTTFWDHVSASEGAEREAELKENFFSKFVAGGARFMRHDRTIESALRVLAHVNTLAPRHVRIQEEIVLEGKKLEETEAGGIRKEELAQLIEKHQREVAELKEALKAVTKENTLARLELALEQEKMKNLVAQWERERFELTKGLDEEKRARQEQEVELRRRMDALHRRMTEEADARRRDQEAKEAEEARKREEEDARRREQEAKEAEEARKREEARREREFRKEQEAERAQEFLRREKARYAEEARKLEAHRLEEAMRAEAIRQEEARLAEELKRQENEEHTDSGWCLLQ
ncbi:hypothetical protein CVT26_009362 [Gymnopilus dilepis]|uniref:G domain-containing protein n=1 Tax=Gymnopilus dilepis TaxID=231916 RepID=A0A409WCG1_9AGAR|nr:hypothetical protein CVT26_009362 [Gymnopilus dilepis]